jgi:hypothetical protein
MSTMLGFEPPCAGCYRANEFPNTLSVKQGCLSEGLERSARVQGGEALQSLTKSFCLFPGNRVEVTPL